ncbi:MAG TPA: ABC transporter substrate-binding protein, partial [Candidatus Saccharimonadales bacterium]|nr:ABC transporter substrate-binding protein [Candidatus Saccharimonadales bacterium]
MSKWLIGGATLLVSSILLLSGCSSAANGTSPARKAVLSVAEAVAPTTLDPQASSLGADWNAWQLSYQCLLVQSPDGTIGPQLASSYTVNAAGTVYTFKLRKGVEFQNGDPFTSADVVYTFQRLQKTGIPYAQSLFAGVGSVQAVGSYQVAFTLTAPNPGFLLNMANPSVVGCAILDSNDSANLAQQMNGTGPYTMTGYQPNAQMTLTAFKHYWGPAPKNAGLKILYVPNPLTAVADLESGGVDLIFPSSASLSTLTANRNVALQSVTADNVDELEINTNAAPFNNVLVRRAIALAINRSQIASLAYGGDAVPTSYLPPGLSWAPQLGTQPYSKPSISEAKSLLAQAGFPNGFTTTLMYVAGYSPQSADEVAVEKSQLAQIGITVNLTPLQIAAWNVALNQPSYGLSWNYYGYFANPAL